MFLKNACPYNVINKYKCSFYFKLKVKTKYNINSKLT